MLKTIFVASLSFWGTHFVWGQGTIGSSKITWMSIEEAEQANKKNPRKIFVDVYTNWCGWCKKMDKTTFADSLVQKYGKEKFYFVKLNAEDQNSIIFKEKVFRYNAQMQANDLAVQLLNGQMSYPTLVFLDEKTTPIQTFGSYMDEKQFLMVLHYFGDNAYKKKKSLDEFAREFKP